MDSAASTQTAYVTIHATTDNIFNNNDDDNGKSLATEPALGSA